MTRLNLSLTQVVRECLYAVIALLLVLVVAEIVMIRFDNFGYNGPKTARKHTGDGVEVYSGQLWRKNEFRQEIQKNQLGFYALDMMGLQDAQFRTAVIGDSFLDARQIPRDKKFTVLAQAMIPGFKVRAFGLGGYKAPLLHKVYEQYFPDYFGEGKVLPSLNAVIFTETYHNFYYTQQNLLMSGELDFSPKSQLLLRVKDFSFKVLPKYWASNINIVSLLTFKLHQAVKADFVSTISLKEDDYGKIINAYRDKELLPLKQLVKERNARLGIVYLPTVEEFKGGRIELKRIRQAMLVMYAEADIPYINALPYLQGEDDLYFPYDQHFTEKGHQYIALAFKDLILNHFYNPSTTTATTAAD